MILSLSAGLSLVSLPLRARSEKLADIFPELPPGSRVFTWNAATQQFVDGFDQDLPLGHACWLYVPVPTVAMVSGATNQLTTVSVELKNGWNLVGVPYDIELIRSRQYAWVHQLKMPFNDAVANQAIGPLVYSFGANGYEVVGDQDSFVPTHGYWVYADGAASVELAPGMLHGGGGGFWGSVVRAAAKGAAEQATAAFLAQMGYGPDQKTDVAGLVDQLDNIKATQTVMLNLLGQTLNKINLSEDEVLQAIGESTSVDPVNAALLTHYEQETPNESLAWFEAQAKGNNTVSMETKTEFAKNVLGQWAFVENFNKLYTAIDPTDKPGLLDHFGDKVVLTSSPPYYDAVDRYLAMEAYFNRLLGMQIKCATLVLNAYTQLGKDPSSAAQFPAPQTANDWSKKVFAPYIEKEIQRFRMAVENVAVAKLTYPTSSEVGVELPSNLQPLLARGDFFVMENTPYPEKEPAGLRVRIVANPSLNVGDVMWKAAQGDRHKNWVAQDWRTVAGQKAYDDWSPPPVQLNVTRNWKITHVILPITAAGTYQVFPPAGHFLSFIPAPETVAAAVFDEGYTPSSTGTLFGSVTVVFRPTATAMLRPCGPSSQPQAVNHCSTLDAPNTVHVDEEVYDPPCGVKYFINSCTGDASIGYAVPFTYAGPYPQDLTLAVVVEYGFSGDYWAPDAFPRLHDDTAGTFVSMKSDAHPISGCRENFGGLDLTDCTWRYTFDFQAAPAHTYSLVMNVAGSSTKSAFGGYLGPFSGWMKFLTADIQVR